VSVTDEKALKSVAAAVGTWDILILGAGYIATPKPIKDSEIDEWLSPRILNVPKVKST
jgi:NADP-dependent 3-hydroxy acid dehydrogenase YdfG